MGQEHPEVEATGGEKAGHVFKRVLNGAMKGLMWGMVIGAALYMLNPISWVAGALNTVGGYLGITTGSTLVNSVFFSGVMAKAVSVGAAFGLADGLSTVNQVDAEKMDLAMRSSNLNHRINTNDATLAALRSHGVGAPVYAQSLPGMGQQHGMAAGV